MDSSVRAAFFNSTHSHLTSDHSHSSRLRPLFALPCAITPSLRPPTGNLSNAGLRNALGGASTGSPLIPQLLYAFFQMEFACVTVSSPSHRFLTFSLSLERLVRTSSQMVLGATTTSLSSSPSHIFTCNSNRTSSVYNSLTSKR